MFKIYIYIFCYRFQKHICFYVETFTLLDHFSSELDFMNIDLHETVNFKFEKKKRVLNDLTEIKCNSEKLYYKFEK